MRPRRRPRWGVHAVAGRPRLPPHPQILRLQGHAGEFMQLPGRDDEKQTVLDVARRATRLRADLCAELRKESNASAVAGPSAQTSAPSCG
jgi:hypothetical protein